MRTIKVLISTASPFQPPVSAALYFREQRIFLMICAREIKDRKINFCAVLTHHVLPWI